LRLLIDEHLSPKLVQWAAELGVYALSVPHVGLTGKPDLLLWHYAFQHDLTLVTTNVRDFIELLDVELHPGLIVIREARLSRIEQ
jgi:predicted nuclease of predicted toxin-antitoxin system